MRTMLSLIVMLTLVLSFAGCSSKKHSSDSSSIPVTGVILKSSTTVAAGGTEQLTAFISPSNAAIQTIHWSSSDKSIAVVSSNGLITGVSAGKARITAVSDSDSSKTAVCDVTISSASVAATGLTLDKSSILLNVNAASALSAVIAPTEATNQNVTWTTSNSSIATISVTTGSGVLVTGISAGSATITATSVSDNKLTASCSVTVGSVTVTGITLNKSSTTILLGKTETLSAMLTPETVSNQTVNWSTSNASVATVTSSGVVAGVAAGTATITASPDGYASLKATCSVTVTSTAIPVTGVTLNKSVLTLTAGSPGTSSLLTATIAPSTATTQGVTWTSSNSSVATVNSSGLVTAYNAGNTTITVTADGGFNATCAVTVNTATAGPKIYITPTGGAGGDGTSSNPKAFTDAIAAAKPGDTLVLGAGTYVYNAQITIQETVNGTAGAMINLVAADGATVVFDFSTQPYGDASSVSNPRGIQINGDYWHVKNIEVKGSADNGMYVSGNFNVIEGCTFHNNRDSGLQIGRAAATLTNKADWPSYNLILNCESYDNYDVAPNDGENADGFACKLTTGPGNVFRGCVSHNNIDDGWDLYTKSATGAIDPVVIDQCIAFGNGTLTNGTANPSGDKNGFKLGGEKIAVKHVVTRCISFKNGKNGFTWNSNPGAIRLVNNTAWDNVEGNFKFDGSGTVPPASDESAAIFYNNLSFWIATSGVVSDRAGYNSGKLVPNNCFWDKSKKALVGAGITGVTTFSAADIQSTTMPSTYPLPRNADGTFNLGNFGKLVSTSPLINSGVVPVTPSETGVPDLPIESGYYTGAPDVGAKEYK